MMASEYRDPVPLARAAIVWTWIWLGVQLPFAAISAYTVAILASLPGETPASIDSPPPELAAIDWPLIVIGVATFAVFVISGFLILKWIYRVNSNAHVYSGEMKVSPGWNVGFFFIPIANLWKPFQGLRETWEVSTMHTREVPGWMRWWWACWLAGNFIDNASFRISLQSETVEGITYSSCLDILSAIVEIPLALLLIRLIRTLTAAQEAMHHGETFA